MEPPRNGRIPPLPHPNVLHHHRVHVEELHVPAQGVVGQVEVGVLDGRAQAQAGPHGVLGKAVVVGMAGHDF